MSTSLRDLDPGFRPYAEALLQIAQKWGLRPRVTSTFRSYAEQARLYDQYLRGRHPYPVAPPGQSQHNYGLAIDLTSRDNALLGEVWNYWGGRWSSGDAVHYGV